MMTIILDMKRIGIVAASLAAAGLMACQPANDSVNQKLDKIAERLDSIQEELKRAPRAGAARGAKGARPQRARPNPKDVYSVPVEGAAYLGNKNAKVTVVEAFEFA